MKHREKFDRPKPRTNCHSRVISCLLAICFRLIENGKIVPVNSLVHGTGVYSDLSLLPSEKQTKFKTNTRYNPVFSRWTQRRMESSTPNNSALNRWMPSKWRMLYNQSRYICTLLGGKKERKKEEEDKITRLIFLLHEILLIFF